MVVLLEEESMHDSAEPSVMQTSTHGAQQKLKSIEDACERSDFDALVKLATSTGGLLTDSLRRKACMYLVLFRLWNAVDCRKGPILLGCMDGNQEENQGQGVTRKTWETLPRHPDEDQVQLDVDRAFVYYPRGSEVSTNRIVNLAKCN